MKCLPFLIVYFLQLTNFKAVTGRSFTVSFPLTQTYRPGDTFSFSCRGTYEEGDKFHFLKVNAYSMTVDGHTCFSCTEDSNATVLSTFSQLEPLLENITDRYSVQGSQNDTWFDYKLTIADIKPEDVGNYSCTVRTSDYDRSRQMIPLKVLTPISRMTILYKARKQARGDMEWNNDDGILTYNTTDGGEIVCAVEVLNTPPIFWEMTLFEPDTNTTTNVTDKFTHEYTEGVSGVYNGGLYKFLTRNHFFARSPNKYTTAPKFDYKDSGKTLTFKAKVEGYDVEEVSTVLNIEFPPVETTCMRGPYRSFEAPVGTRNFTLICFTRSNTETTTIWRRDDQDLRPGVTVHDQDLRPGVTVHNQNKGKYLVSLLVIDEVKDSDYGLYSFTAENKLGTGEASPVQLNQGDAVSQPSLDDPVLPWNEAVNEGDTSGSKKHSFSACVGLVGLLVYIGLL